MVRYFAVAAFVIALFRSSVCAEVYHEPQVRYILADIQLGGSVDYYGKWAKEENDPDSKRAVKEWHAGTRVHNIAAFERKTVEFKLGKGMRIVYKGTNRTIDSKDIVLTKDLNYRQGDVRYHVADLTLGLRVAVLESRKSDPSVVEALSRWADGGSQLPTRQVKCIGQERGQATAQGRFLGVLGLALVKRRLEE